MHCHGRVSWLAAIAPLVVEPHATTWWVTAEHASVSASSAAEAARLGLLDKGSALEISGCTPACDAPHGWALLDPSVAVPLRALGPAPPDER